MMNGNESMNLDEFDESDRRLRAALDEAAPESNERLDALLGAFREKLERHPAIRKIERERCGACWLPWLRRVLRYGLAMCVLILFGASLTAGGRQAILGKTLGVYDAVNGFFKRRIDAGFDSYAVYQHEKNGFVTLTPQTAVVRQALGLTSDKTKLLLRVESNDTKLNWRGNKLSNAALWAVDLASGRIESIQDRVLGDMHVVPAKDPEGKVAALVYKTHDAGFWKLSQAVLTGNSCGARLWFYDGQSSPALIDEGRTFYDIAIAPDQQKIFYQKERVMGDNQTYIYDRTKKETRPFNVEGTNPYRGEGHQLAGWYPRGDAVLLAKIHDEGQQILQSLQKVSLSDGKILEQIAIPGRRHLTNAILTDANTVAVSHDLAFPMTTQNPDGTRSIHLDEQTESVALEPLKRLETANVYHMNGALGNNYFQDRSFPIHSTQTLTRLQINPPKVIAQRPDSLATAPQVDTLQLLNKPDSAAYSYERAHPLTHYGVQPAQTPVPWRFTVLLDPQDRDLRPHPNLPPAPASFFNLALLEQRPSPDGKWRAALIVDPATHHKTCVIYGPGGQVKRFEALGEMAPLAWLDAQRVVWANTAAHGKQGAPLTLMVTNAVTGEIRPLETHMK